MVLLSRASRYLPAIIFVLTGVSIAYTGTGYRMGSLTAMGPGFMPVLLGCLLAALGLLILWLGYRDTQAQAPIAWPLRPVLCAGGGIVVWALFVDAIGFFPASMAQLLLSVLALPQQNWSRVVVGCALFCLAAWGVFVLMLGLPLPAFQF